MPAFVPTDIDGAALWLRGDRGITLNASAVSAWANGGSLGGTFSQATATKQPTYNASDADFDGRPTLTFDGTADQLDSSLAASSWNFLSNGTGCTVITVHRTASGRTGDNHILSTQNSSGHDGFRQYWRDAAGGQAVVRVQTAAADRFSLGANTTLVKTVLTSTYTGSTITLRINGVAGTPGGSGTPNPSANHTLILGSLLTGAGAAFFGGKLAEVIAYARVLTGTEITTVEEYLNARYAI